MGFILVKAVTTTACIGCLGCGEFTIDQGQVGEN